MQPLVPMRLYSSFPRNPDWDPDAGTFSSTTKQKNKIKMSKPVIGRPESDSQGDIYRRQKISSSFEAFEDDREKGLGPGGEHTRPIHDESEETSATESSDEIELSRTDTTEESLLA